MPRIAVLLSCFLAACPTLAQEEDEFAPSLEVEDLIEVSEVLIDVLATDAEGQTVLGLDSEDFVVEEDGQPVPVTSVHYYTTRYDGTGEAGEIPSSRYFLLFFDVQPRDLRYGNIMLMQRLRASRDIQRWVREEMSASDWMAVVRWNGKLQIYQDFTQEGEALVEAIRRAASGKGPNAFAPAARRDAARRGSPAVSLSKRLPSHNRARGRENVYQAIGRLAEATSFLIGRKNLLLLTTGFGDESGFMDSEPDPEHYPRLETLLNDHNVAVYPIDLTPPGRPARQRDFLDRLATDTGGYYDENFSGFLDPVKDVADDNYGYYLLSFQSARPAGEIGYQRLEVRARDPKIEVRARRGYRYGL